MLWSLYGDEEDDDDDDHDENSNCHDINFMYYTQKTLRGFSSQLVLLFWVSHPQLNPEKYSGGEASSLNNAQGTQTQQR